MRTNIIWWSTRGAYGPPSVQGFETPTQLTEYSDNALRRLFGAPVEQTELEWRLDHARRFATGRQG